MIPEINRHDKIAKIVFFLLISAISIHLAGYHISKTLMDIAGVISLGYIVLNLKPCFSNLKKQDFIWISILLALPASYAISYLLHGSTLDYEYAITTLRLSLIGVSTYTVIRLSTGLPSEKIEQALMLCALTGGAAGLYKWGVNDFSVRVSVGTNLTIIYASVLAATTAATIVSLIQGSVSSHYKFLFITAALLGTLGVIASGSKGPLASLLLVSFFILLTASSNRHRAFMISAIVLVICFSAQTPLVKNRVTAVIEGSKLYFQEETYLQVRTGTPGTRLEMWRASIDSIQKNPLIGYGSWHLRTVFSEKIASNERSAHIGRFDHVHNDILQTMLSRGLLGLIVLLALLYYPAWKVKSRVKVEKILVTSIALTFSFNGLTDAVMLRTTSLSFFLIVVSMILALSFHSTNRDKGSQ